MKKKKLLDLVLKTYFALLKFTAKAKLKGEAVTLSDNSKTSEAGLDKLLLALGINPSDLDALELKKYEEEVIEELRDEFVEMLYKRLRKENKDFKDILREEIDKYNEAVALVIGVPIYELLRGSFIHPENVPYLLTQVELSKRLWRNAVELQAKVLKLLNEKIAAKATIREIREALFKGYNNPDDVLPLINKLPQYLQDAIKKGEAGKRVKRLIEQIKTAPLKASYKKLIDLLEKETDKAFKQAIHTALTEKTRFYALRIAETETFRAVNFAQFRDFLANDEVQFVKFELSSLHKKRDICDFYANLDLGYGRGIYPKNEARALPLHPFCRCKYVPVYRVRKYEPRSFKEAEREFLSKLPDKVKHEILGTWKNVALWKQGLDAETIFNLNRPSYKIIKFTDAIDTTIAKLTYDEMQYKKAIMRYKLYSFEDLAKLKDLAVSRFLQVTNDKSMYNLLNKLKG